jgi:hypothetical protein
MRRLVPWATALALAMLPALHAAPLDVAGAWKLNRELSSLPPAGAEGRPPGERRAGGGRGGGRGGFGGIPGIGGGTGQPSDDEIHKREVVRRRLYEFPERLVIVHEDNTVSITDGYGRHLSFKADGKKQQQVTGDGEFKTKTHFEGANLIIEEDFGGPKVTTTYTPVLGGGEILRLEVTLKIEGVRGGPSGGAGSGHDGSGPGGPPPLKRVYDREGR